MLRIPAVLNTAEVARCLALVKAAEWADGRITAGTQSAVVKNNLQLPEMSEASRAARSIVLAGLERSALFFAAALPKRIFPPLFNCYTGGTNAFGNHVDNAVRRIEATGQRVRTDLSATLFLSAPTDYDGGELTIEDAFGARSVKLAAGDMLLYSASSVHRVEPVTRGARIASFFWLESMVGDSERRRLLLDLDMSIVSLRESAAHQGAGDSAAIVQLTNCYHNLLRMWGHT